MNYSLEEIITFLKVHTGDENLYAETDLHTGAGVDGDDFQEMIEGFSEKFLVDISQYRWYFHAGEEGFPLLGQFFFPPPYRQVKRIPVTPVILLEIANQGKWNIIYPEHKITEKRYDLIINQIIAIAAGLFILLILAIKYGSKYGFWSYVNQLSQ